MPAPTRSCCSGRCITCGGVLTGCARWARPGGWCGPAGGAPVFAAAISRWALRIDDVLVSRMSETYPDLPELTAEVERTGQLPPLGPGLFSGFCHRPRQLRAELREAGLTVADLVSVEGPAFLLADLPERLADPATRAVVLDTARALERVPELLGVGPHLLATGLRPLSGRRVATQGDGRRYG